MEADQPGGDKQTDLPVDPLSVDASGESAGQQGAQLVSPPATVESTGGAGGGTAPPGLESPAGSSPDALTVVTAALRQDPVLRTRLVDYLLEEDTGAANARTEGRVFLDFLNHV